MAQTLNPLPPELFLWEEALPGGCHWSVVMKRGSALRLTDLSGRANVSALFYNAEEKLERYNMPDTLKAQVGDWLFGCDVCQEVCPWNVRFAVETTEPRYRARPKAAWPALQEIAALTEQAFDDLLGMTALVRAGRTGLARNALVVIENIRRRGEPQCPAA